MKRHIQTLAIFTAFWAVFAFLAWLRIATQVFTVWFWAVIGVLLATEVYFLVFAVLCPRRWRGAGLRDVFWTLFPGLCAAVTYVFWPLDGASR